MAVMTIRSRESNARTRLQMKRVFDVRPVCPAAYPIAETAHGSGVRCRIEQSTLTADTDPASMAFGCLGPYTRCPSWRAMRDAEWARRGRALADEIASDQNFLPSASDRELWTQARLNRARSVLRAMEDGRL
jgi:hypothetical protein